MPPFNPDLPDVAPQQTINASRGRQADPGQSSTFAQLFEGVTSVGTNIVNTADFYLQKSLEKFGRVELDKAFDEFGFSTQSGAVDPQVMEGMPNEVKDQMKNLSKLGAARNAGKLLDTAYWARVQSIVRQMRTKYPGYRTEIDNFMRQETGNIPANALRRSLTDTISSAYDTSSKARLQEENKISSWVGSKLLTEPELAAYDRGIIDFKEVRSRVNTRQALQGYIERTTAQTEFNKKQKTDYARGAAIAKVSGDLSSSISTALGFGNIQEFGNYLTSLQNKIQSGQAAGLGAEAQTQIQQQFNLLRTIAEAEVNNIINQYPGLDADARKDIKDSSLGIFGVYEKALNDKNFGLLFQLTNSLEAMKNADQARLLQEPFWRKYAAIEKVVGPDGAAIQLSRETDKALKSLDSFEVADRGLNVIGRRGNTLTDQVDQMQKQSGITTPQAYTTLLDNVTNFIKAKQVTPQQLEVAIDNVYQPNSKLMEKFNNADWLKVYTKLTSPTITEKMKEVRETRPDLWNKYTTALKTQFSTIYADRINTFSQVLEQTGAEITFDPATHSFGIVGGDTGGEGVDSVGEYQQGQVVIDELNSALKSLAPVLEEEGKDLAYSVDFVLKQIGVRPEQVGLGGKIQRALQPHIKVPGLGEALDAAGKSLNQAFFDPASKAVSGLFTTPSEGGATGDFATGATGDIPPESAIGGSTFGGQRFGGNTFGASRNASEEANEAVEGYVSRETTVADRSGKKITLTADEKKYLQEFQYDPQLMTPEEKAIVSAEATADQVIKAQERTPIVATDTDFESVEVALGIDDDVVADPKTKELRAIIDEVKEFIGGVEAPNGYNQIYGVNQSAPLDEMNIKEVFNLQRSMVKRNRISSAVGKYQFLKGTLADMVRKYNIPLDQKFTPEFQDWLFVTKLKERGLKEYQEGKISLEKFATQVAQEWASMPVLKRMKGAFRTVNRGESYYAGDTINKSLVNPDELERLLEKLKT